MSLTKLGRYDLIRVLGKGAMGLVYEGRDPNLDRRVAIKTIRVENLSEEAAAEYEVRFRTEARSAARLQHPNIVSVYDSDRDGDTAFLVMEFIQGDDLKYHLDRGERYSLEQSLAIMGDLLAALDYAHRQNIVHRDIKPANLLIEPGGRVKLTDFGVARIQDSGDATRTQGTMVGTLKYMSPEQVQGLPVDARADLFAAGVVLYQLLTGKRPFDGETDFAIIQQIVGHAPAAPTSFNPQLPPAIDGVMARALVKSRDQRFATAQEFASALQAASHDAADPTVVPPASPTRAGSGSTWTGTVHESELLRGLQSGSHSSLSIVTQELELVYWKDIKDSNDVEDLQVFLAKFPAGIYAPLARRRLRKLGVLAGEDTDVGAPEASDTLVIPRSASQLEKTLLLPRKVSSAAAPALVYPGADSEETWLVPERSSVPAQTSFPTPTTAAARPAVKPLAAPPAPAQAAVLPQKDAAELPEKIAVAPAESAPQPALASDLATQRGAGSSWLARHRGWALAGVVTLAGVAWGLSFRGGPAAPVALVPAAATLGTSTPAGAAPPVDAAPPATSATTVPLAAPVAAASKADVVQASARKSASDKNKLAKAAQVTASNKVLAPSAHRPASDEPVVAAAVAHAAVSATNPRQACEDRILIGFLNCMAAQCAKPAFSRHPVCLERLAIEQRRRDAEQQHR